MLQLHQMRIYLYPNRLFVIFNGSAEDELKEIVKHKGTFEFICLAEHEKV